MSYTSLLIDTLTTQRFTEGSSDAYGNPAITWADNLTAQACRLTTLSGGRELKVGAELVLADYRLFVLDIDIVEQDRVVIGLLTYEVLLVEDYADGVGEHHKQVWMRISR